MAAVEETGTSLLVTIEQVVTGDAKCHCGEDAVLRVTTEPDGEPGLTCYEHAMEWVDSTLYLTRELFGPKEG